MNEEQNDNRNVSDANNTGGDESLKTGGTSSDNAPSQDDYYAVDHVKKDVISSVGDGEMHNEGGLLGTGDINSDIQSSAELMTDEQDEAELHDSEE